MTKYPHQEKGTLVLALIAGLSVNGSFPSLFSSIVPFSVFPLVALVLLVYCLHQRYLNIEMPKGIPLLYSAFVCVEYLQIGSNFPAFITVCCVGVLDWLAA